MNTQNSGAMPEGISGIEQNGVDFIPEDQRHSNPFNFGLVWVGAQFSFNLIVLGWLPVSFGLGWWSALSAITVGLIIGTAVYAPFGLFGPRTGTNSAVSSGAHFGVVGRLIGTCLSLFIALGFFGLVIWTGGDSLVLGLNKLFGTHAGDGVRALGYAVMGVITLSLAVYGHDKVVASQKWVTVIIGVVLLLGLFALGGKFDAGYKGGEYLLGGFWATWVLGVVTGISAPISYAPFVNDYSRYISPKRFTQKQVLAANAIGMFFGCWTVMAFGAFEGTLAPIDLGPVGALVEASPKWYVIPVIMIGTIGTLAQGALCLYGTGLDTSSLIPKLPRPVATLLLGTVGIAVVFLGAFVFDAIALINAFVILLTVVTSPWIIINLIGYWSRRGWYDPADLQVFNRGEKGGRYWFTMGWNLRAMCAWVPAVVVGLLCAQTTEYTGPWADVANGVDVSIVSAMVIGGVIYAVLLKVYPEAPEVRGEGQAAADVPSAADVPGDVLPDPAVLT
ncbi:MAG: putative purine/cytosine permease [Conexibacter sp.]|nr:putative purine/cytosine permease [Conexibacter sp.]